MTRKAAFLTTFRQALSNVQGPRLRWILVVLGPSMKRSILRTTPSMNTV